MANLISRVFRRSAPAPKEGDVEKSGAPRSTFGYPLPITGGFIPSSWPWNFWQQGRDPINTGPNSAVHACVDAYAQTLASMRLAHVIQNEDVGTQVIKTSALSRIARSPNGYQTRNDFFQNMVKSLMLTGNAYAYATRNDRQEVDALHLVHPNTTQVYIEPEEQAVFYGLGNNPLLDPDTLHALVPARDMLHIRLYTPHHPLIGVSVIENLALSIAANNAIGSHNASFFTNMRRPSGVLSTTERLNREQMATLREAWDAQSQHLNSGGVPILSAGLKWDPMSISSTDAQTIEAYRVSIEDIARAFRVPLPIIGDTRNASYGNVEDLASLWLALGLGYVVDLVEQALNKFFSVPQETSAMFDTDGLLRTDFSGRMDALAKAVQGGVYSPNEARRKEGLKKVPFGDEPRLQAQQVPLSAAGQIPESTPTAPSADGAPQTAPDDDDEDPIDEDQEAEAAELKLKGLMA